MGYVPDLHKIWVGTSDQQLMTLSNEFPGFYRYALIMEEASEAERNNRDGFKNSLRAQGAEPKALEYVNEAVTLHEIRRMRRITHVCCT